jgi:putative transposase
MSHIKRKPTRLKEYDYSTPAYYFVTICTNNKIELFCDVINDKIKLNNLGIIIDDKWKQIPVHYPHVELDSYCIMPHHLHGIIILNHVGESSPLPYTPTLGQIIGYFKYQSTKDINNLTKSPGKKIWQRSFYDRIIRDEKELYRIRKYIEQNPIKWEIEMEHPNNIDL